MGPVTRARPWNAWPEPDTRREPDEFGNGKGRRKAGGLMEVLLENALEIKRSKRLKGQPLLPGDGLTGFHALLMGALAEGPTRLENLPDSPWFRDILQDFIRMGYAQQALDGHWTIHGGSDPVSGPEALRVRHEAELLALA